MAKLVYAMMHSLDGYVSGREGAPGLPMPDDALHQHFSDQLNVTTGSLFGRNMYEIMRYWDTDEAAEGEVGRAFAVAFRAKPKWVVSRTLKEVGPNATLVDGDLASFVARLKAEQPGTIEVAGPNLAGSLTALGLIDEYVLYLCPVVLGAGNPFFVGARPPLRLTETEQFGSTMRLVYVPA
jgi:dihydrofolate reductase